MTREEAIKGLKNVKEQMFGKSPFTEALDMAIQALSQEPCDDVVSREYLKKIAQSEGAYGYVSAHDIATGTARHAEVGEVDRRWILRRGTFT